MSIKYMNKNLFKAQFNYNLVKKRLSLNMMFIKIIFFIKYY